MDVPCSPAADDAVGFAPNVGFDLVGMNASAEQGIVRASQRVRWVAEVDDA
jgi:hypothetical protein